MGFGSWIKKAIGGTIGKVVGTAAFGPIGGALLGWGAGKLFGGGGGGGGGGGSGGSDEKRYKQNFDQSVEAERGRGTRFSDEYEQRALAYDPQESINRSVTGAANIAMPRIQAGQVDRGRHGTGFGFQEEDEYMANLIASKSMEAEQYRFENMRDIGGYGERSRDRTMDADFGRYSTERMAREQDKASKRGMWGSIIGSGLGAAGRIIAGR